MNNRFTLEPSGRFSYLKATDHEIGIEVTFKRYDFERTKEIVMLDGENYNSTEQAMAAPMALREIELWLRKKYFAEAIAPIEDKRVEMGRTIQRLRLKRGMTEQELSDAAGITIANIINIERGKYYYRLDVLNRIAHVLGAKIEMKLL